MNYVDFHMVCIVAAVGLFLWTIRKGYRSESSFVMALSLLAVSSFGAGIIDTFPPVEWSGVWLNLFAFSLDMFFILHAIPRLRAHV